MTKFPIVIEEDDNGTFLVSFPDIPEAHTFGDTPEDAAARAVDALVTALEARIADRDPIPDPTRVAEGQPSVVVPALVDAKVYLYRIMRRDRVSKADLARRLHVHMPQVDRLLNLRHRSRFDQLADALQSFGYCLSISVAKSHCDGPTTSTPRRVTGPGASRSRSLTARDGIRKR